MEQKSILTNSAVEQYLNCDYAILKDLKTISFFKKLKNEKEIRKLSEQMINEIKPYRIKESNKLTSEELKEVKEILTSYILKLDEKKLLFNRPFLKFFLEKGYLNVAEEFIASAKKNDSKLNATEVFQAMRNVWIMNSLQIFWGIPLEMTPSIYSYSMLYPYTDNFLDDSNIDINAKKDFNGRLHKVIEGERLTPNNFYETRVFNFIEQIESQYNRNEYRDVFNGLLLILEAQSESLKQDSQTTLTREEILKLSFFKGGSSVLADAYLVKGKLTGEEQQFSFHYGTFLQLLDDLQDAEEDRQEGHKTLFSIMKKDDLLDDEVKRLISHIYKINEPSKEDSKSMLLMKEVIRTCTLIMVLDVLGKSPSIVSKKLYHKLQSYSNVRLSFYAEFELFLKKLMIDFDFTKPIEGHLNPESQSFY